MSDQKSKNQSSHQVRANLECEVRTGADVGRRGWLALYAKKLVRAFGEAVLEVIAQEPSRLREVIGIGPKRAERITASWAEQQIIREDHAVPAQQRRRHFGSGTDL